ncbi:MAG: hypothetical protein IKV87_00250 [Methanobrevibacter sp.]|nr:hypothetical protein [Methanobrevibacter sp.]
MKVLISSMAAMAETGGPSKRARLLAEGLRNADIEIATCIAEDVNYKPMAGIKNYYLEVPMPLGLPKSIASHTFPIAQKLGITERKTVNSFEDVLHFTGNNDYQYLVKSVRNVQDAIKDFNPDIVYSEFNISAIIAAKLENKRLFTTISYPTQAEYASTAKYAKGLKRFLKENNLPDVNSTLDLFNWAAKTFVPSIRELEPINKDTIFCGSWEKNGGKSKYDNVILVYMGNGTISPNKMLKEIKDAFIDSEYEVYIASKGLKKEDFNNIHVDKSWDFSKLLNDAVLFINHGGQNSIIDGLSYGVPQLICPGKVFERIYNAKSVKNVNSGKMLSADEFKSERIRQESEKLINDTSFRESSRSIGDKLKSKKGINCIIDSIMEEGKNV